MINLTYMKQTRKLLIFLTSLVIVFNFNLTLAKASCVSPTQSGSRYSCDPAKAYYCALGAAVVSCCDQGTECPSGSSPGSNPDYGNNNNNNGQPNQFIQSNSAIYCNNNNGIDTAIGCIPLGTTLSPTINAIVSWALGIAGGIAFILLIVAGFQYATSAGDPKRAKAAQELITSALSGLLLISLAVLILNFIGVRVLGLNHIGFSIP